MGRGASVRNLLPLQTLPYPYKEEDVPTHSTFPWRVDFLNRSHAHQPVVAAAHLSDGYVLIGSPFDKYRGLVDPAGKCTCHAAARPAACISAGLPLDYVRALPSLLGNTSSLPEYLACLPNNLLELQYDKTDRFFANTTLGITSHPSEQSLPLPLRNNFLTIQTKKGHDLHDLFHLNYNKCYLCAPDVRQPKVSCNCLQLRAFASKLHTHLLATLPS